MQCLKLNVSAAVRVSERDMDITKFRLPIHNISFHKQHAFVLLFTTVLQNKKCYQIIHPLSSNSEPSCQLVHDGVELLELDIEGGNHLQLIVHALKD